MAERGKYGTKEQDDIVYDILGCAMEVYNTLGPGLLESIYHKALRYELDQRGYHAVSEVPVRIQYKDIQLGDDLRIDILVNEQVIIELKSVVELLPLHYKQLRTYMKLTNHSIGVLLNFNEGDFKQGIKVLTPHNYHAAELGHRRKHTITTDPTIY